MASTIIKQLEKNLSELEGTAIRFEEQLRGEKKWAELVRKYHNATEVTAEMVDAMIISMKMNEDSSLSIEFNHMDELRLSTISSKLSEEGCGI